MSSVVYAIIDKFKGFWISESTPQKKEIEGYLILNDTTNNKTLLLVKEGEKSWRTKWFNDNEHSYKIPTVSVAEIFNHSV